MAYDMNGIQQIYDWIPTSGIQKGWQAPNGVTIGTNDDKPITVIQDYKNIYGRPPTPDELQAALPAAQAGQGGAFIANLHQQEQNTPEAIYQRQQQQYLTDAPKFSSQVSQVFQSQLGRAPTSDELSHFGALMASGQDAYQVQQALQQTQEFQNTQNTNFQNQLQGQLQQSNATYFNQFIAPSLQAQNALSGQAPGSSALSAQLSQAALQQNQGLQNFLAGTSAQNYQNSVANAQNQYQGLMGQQYGLQNAGVSNTLANQAANQQYGQNLSLYQMQQQAYNNYLNAYGKRNGLASGLSGALSGGIGGALAGSKFGPYGTLLGGLGGAGLGGASGAYL